MKTIHQSAVALAAATLCALTALPAQAATQTVAASASETANNLWFVEFKGLPMTEGVAANRVKADHDAFAKAAKAAGVQFKLRKSFSKLFNGVSVEISDANRAKLERLPQVANLYPVVLIPAPTPVERAQAMIATNEAINSISMIQADRAQNELGLTGMGVKVGVIDTGIDIDHPAFGGNGTPGSTTFPTARIAYGYDFVGDAFNADPRSPAYNPIRTPDANPDDCGGHGTHVAGIVGANGGGLIGVAPNATLGAYRVFGCAGSTTAEVMLEAMEMAKDDGMQVVNMSIGAAFQWPKYPTAVAADRMARGGVVTIASAGNSGTAGLYASSAPALGKHVVSVASYDNAAARLNQFTVSPDGTAIGYAPATGSPAAPTSGSLPMSRTGNVDSLTDACTALPPGSLTGTAALVRRGGCAFHIKALNAQTAGAAAVVIYNNVPGRINATVVGTPAITVPTVSISDTEGALINSRLASGAVDLTWTADIGNFPSATGGLVSSFSSYGLAPDLTLKPNVGAPGGAIYSTYPLEGGGYATLSGTSMAAPHVAGAAALMLQNDPTLGARPMEFLARGQNTAKPALWAGNPALGLTDTVQQQGAGMVQVVDAIQATTLVGPSQIALGESQSGPVTRQLTIQNRSANPMTYTMGHQSALATGPDTFVYTYYDAPAGVVFSSETVMVPAGGKAKVNVTITAPEGLDDRSMYDGYLTVTPVGGESPVARVPYAGFKGDYQTQVVLTPTANGFPWLAKLADGTFTKQPDGATFTMATGDQPYFLVHLNHQSNKLGYEVVDQATGKVVGTFGGSKWVGRNDTASNFFNWLWNGTVVNKQGATVTVPNGNYTVRLGVLKALGKSGNAADWETWSSPTVTIARP